MTRADQDLLIRIDVSLDLYPSYSPSSPIGSNRRTGKCFLRTTTKKCCPNVKHSIERLAQQRVNFRGISKPRPLLGVGKALCL